MNPHRKHIAEHPEVETFLWAPRAVLEICQPVVGEVTQSEIHVIPEATADGAPALCFVMETQVGVFVTSEISLEAIWPAIEAAIKCKGQLS